MAKHLDLKALKTRASDVSELLKLLSHPNRLLIACALTDGEKNVGELERETGVAQPHVSRELARLRAAELVVDRRASKNVYYEISDPRLIKLIDALCDAFAGDKKRAQTKRSGRSK